MNGMMCLETRHHRARTSVVGFYLPTIRYVSFGRQNYKVDQAIPKSILRIFRNKSPCSGVVRKSSAMSTFSVYSTLIYPDSILCFTKNRRIPKYIVVAAVGIPCSIRAIVHMLSGNIVEGTTLIPSSCRKSRVQINCGSTSARQSTLPPHWTFTVKLSS